MSLLEKINTALSKQRILAPDIYVHKQVFLLLGREELAEAESLFVERLYIVKHEPLINNDGKAIKTIDGAKYLVGFRIIPVDSKQHFDIVQRI